MSLTFFTENCVCILPNSSKKEVLAAEYIQLSSKLAFQERHKDNTMVQTAMSLQEQTK